MDDKYIQITFLTSEQQLKEELIASLAVIGFDGFEETEDGLYAFINEKDFYQKSFSAIILKYEIPFKKTVVAQQNWNALWEASFEPVVVKNFVAIRAAFHQPIKNIEHEIIITPKMSFGTGHHATTFMMMQQMRDIDFKNKTVFDFGTGTGVLAILAEKLGAASVLAIDKDEWSIDNAKENLIANACSRIDICLKDNPQINKQFDIILANINKNVILENIKILARQIISGGYLLLSGLLMEDENDILNAAKNAELKFILTIQKDKWICVQFVK